MPVLRLAAAILCLPLAFCPAPAHAQAPATQQQVPGGKQLDPTTLAALERLSGLIDEATRGRDRVHATGDAAGTAAADQRLRELRWQFAGLASRLDVQDFEAPQKREFQLQKEVEELIRPLLDAIKDATEEPRQIAELKARIDLLQQRQRTAEDALRAVEQTRLGVPAGSPALAELDRELRERWRPTIESLRGEVVVLQARLQARDEGQTSLVDGLSRALKNFVQSSGTSLVLAGMTFAGVFFGLRFVLERLLRRRSPERGLSMRLFEVGLQALSILAAIGATILVPWLRNDWLLLAVCIVFLIGAGWVVIRTLPQFFEQIRLVLNVGGVREGERILVEGIPYRVAALRLYSTLDNPDLQGGTLRVPIQHLIGKRSRRSAPGEPWFPCRKDDVVALSDGTVGAVLAQTPEVVVVENYGTPRSYPTAEFLKLSPRNLSGGFVVSSTIGIDYRHQKDAATVVPDRLRDALHQGLAACTAPGELIDVRVELQAAGSSSIDFLALARCSGTAAARFLELQRRLQAILVAACTQHGFVIPFPQLTVHDTRA